MRRQIVMALLAGVAVAWGMPAPVFAQAHIVFAAGPKDHGAPGRHEYPTNLAALKACLESSNVKGITTALYTGKVPDVSALSNAAVLVMESSGDRTPTETHVLFPQDITTDHQGYDAATTARFAAIDALAKKGMGVVVFHYATYVNNATGRKYFTDWVGGFYESGYSRTVTTNWTVAPTATNHPILRGVEPFTTREEFYIRLRMPEADPRRTPLLIATPVQPTRLPALTQPMVPGGPPSPLTDPNVEPSLVSWAVQREGRGRGFVMTGPDWFSNLSVDSYRRQLLNGIVWAANLDVPAGGVQCSIPADLVPPPAPPRGAGAGRGGPAAATPVGR
jgi:type 1 glutamine amidotransferase